LDTNALLPYLSALPLSGLNGIAASHIAMNRCGIVFLRTLIGSALLVMIFLLAKGKFHAANENKDSLLP